MTQPEPSDKDPREPIPDPAAETREPQPIVRLLTSRGGQLGFSFHSTVAEATAAAESYPEGTDITIESGHLDGFNFVPSS